MGKLGLIGLLAILLFSGCAESGPPETLRSAKPRTAASSITNGEINALVSNNNEFAVSLYHRLGKGAGNLIVSPYGISLTSAMVYAGARGETDKEIAKTMRFALPQERLPKVFNGLDLALARQGEKEQEELFCLKSVNTLWGQSGDYYETPFLDTLALYYGADVKMVDFSEAPEAARQTINTWARRETEGKIVSLLPEGSVTTVTKLLLAEAAYFKAEWMLPFETKATRPGTFTLPNGEEITVPLMRQTNCLKYTKGKDYQAVELPYEMGKYAFLILLPQEGQFGLFEQKLDGKSLAEITENLRPVSEVELALPKFAFASGFMLKAALSDLGMPSAFGQKADFSGMNTRGGLFIDEIYHKTIISIDEKGSEVETGAAAAAILAPGASLETVGIRVDRPFFFLIRNLDTGSIIFLGRVLDPRA